MNDVIIEINKEPAFTEIWYEGSVKYEETKHRFWLVYPKSFDDAGHQYEMNIKWFFAKVPKEIRAMENKIIDAFKQTLT